MYATAYNIFFFFFCSLFYLKVNNFELFMYSSDGSFATSTEKLQIVGSQVNTTDQENLEQKVIQLWPVPISIKFH